jgi:hypothetical protein
MTETSSPAAVLVTRDEHVMIIIINRPEVRTWG